MTVHDREGCLTRLARALPARPDETCPEDRLYEASTEELEQWLGTKGWSTKTRETYWCHIVGFYRWAAKPGRNQRIDWDPSEDLKRPAPKPGRPRVATDDQLRQCLDRLDHHARRAVVLAAGAGMRASEIANAERDDFNQRRVIIVGKGEKARVVPLIPEVWDEVQDCPPGRLIIHNGAPVIGHWITMLCSAALTKAGFPQLTIHWFRGAFATRLRRSGVDIAAISKLLGHSSVATTQRYLEMLDEDLELAISKLPRLDEAAGRRNKIVGEDAVANGIDVTAISYTPAALNDVSIGRNEPDGSRLVPPAAEAA